MHFFALGMHNLHGGAWEPTTSPWFPGEKKSYMWDFLSKESFQNTLKVFPYSPTCLLYPTKTTNKQTKSFLFFSSDFFLLGVEKGSGPENHEVVVLVLLN